MFELFRKKDINQGVEEWKSTEGAILLDVRTKEEYRTYHIDGSINIPLQSQKANLSYTDAPKAEFLLADGDEFVAAYEYCNLHGLWKSN